MDLAVQPTFELRVAEEAAAPYLGWYDQVIAPVADTTRSYRVTQATLHIEYRNGSLFGKQSVKYVYKGKEQQYSYEVFLLPNKDGSFAPGFVMKGELAGTNPGAVYEFKRTDGKVTGVEERFNDKLEGTFSRRP